MHSPTFYPKVSVVICALNEAKNLSNVLPQIPNWVHEIILVDGHSTDCTIEVAKQIRPDVKVLSQPNKGKGDALKYGVASSEGDIIITLDADGTYPPGEMINFVNAILQGYDFAKGTRFFGNRLDSMPAKRQLGNKILTLTCNFLFQTRYTDVCSGYYAFRTNLFKEICLVSSGFEMEQELFAKIAKKKYNVIEVPHSYKNRFYGNSKTKDFRQGIKNIMLFISLRFLSPTKNK